MGEFVDEGACVACPIGYATPAPNETQCRVCAGGRVADAEASVTCMDCPLGWFAVETQPNCTVCPAGQFQDVKAMFSCKNCSTGMYIGDDGENGDQHNDAGDCVECPEGQFANDPGLSFCTPCFAGRYEHGGRCADCPAGWQQKENRKNSCSKCPTGQYQQSAGQPYCLPCVPGFYWGNESVGALKCTACETGRYQNEVNASACKNVSDGFESNEAGTGSTTQNTCPPGSYGLGVKARCSACPSGWSQKRSGQIECGICSAGMYAHENGSTTCPACSPGTYSTLSGSVECELCPTGWFQTNGSSSGCEGIGLGHEGVEEGEGNTAQVSCPPGSYGTGGASACTACPSGWKNKNSTATVCERCGESEWTVGVSGATFCEACAAGKFMRNSSCASCPRGFSSVVGQTVCEECVRGKYATGHDASSEDATSCALCPEGKYGKAAIGDRLDENAACQSCIERVVLVGRGALRDRVGLLGPRRAEGGDDLAFFQRRELLGHKCRHVQKPGCVKGRCTYARIGSNIMRC